MKGALVISIALETERDGLQSLFGPGRRTRWSSSKEKEEGQNGVYDPRKARQIRTLKGRGRWSEPTLPTLLFSHPLPRTLYVQLSACYSLLQQLKTVDDKNGIIRSPPYVPI